MKSKSVLCVLCLLPSLMAASPAVATSRNYVGGGCAFTLFVGRNVARKAQASAWAGRDRLKCTAIRVKLGYRNRTGRNKVTSYVFDWSRKHDFSAIVLRDGTPRYARGGPLASNGKWYFGKLWL